ncbi:helix-turn-helix transcriptional regulator [Mesoflavibacter zeaxanthinifaciens]|uniref:helix-turn-helix transcriptional regulator n=1 Tax=Mesoflavibacter zeaxanthinifaciens TaxID=393060 RepID=UPI0003F6954A|nr:helix-turn-helix transcriptional regulator [Mesoflavibacter zeaxanthinifaciens]
MVATPIWNVSLITQKPIENYPKEHETSLGAALKRTRLKKGLTQEHVANNLQLLLQNYSRFEKNIHIPSIKKRKKINEFLGYNFWDDGTETLSNIVLLYRIENQLSAKEFGKIIGVSRNTIKRIELKNNVSEKSKRLIIKFLKMIE